jgi:hypothetical protein
MCCGSPEIALKIITADEDAPAFTAGFSPASHVDAIMFWITGQSK